MVKKSTGQINPVWITIEFHPSGEQIQQVFLSYTDALEHHNLQIARNAACALAYTINADAKKPKIQIFNRFYPSVLE